MSSTYEHHPGKKHGNADGCHANSVAELVQERRGCCGNHLVGSGQLAGPVPVAEG